MSKAFWKLLGLGGEREKPDPADLQSLRAIADALERLEPRRARFIACYAYLLSRVARADHVITPEETQLMERLVSHRGGLPPDQAVVVVQLARAQTRLFGGTEDFLVAREFNRIATREEKLSVLHCLFAVAALGGGIGTVQDNEIRRITRELRIGHDEYIAVRAQFREHLTVLKTEEEQP